MALKKIEQYTQDNIATEINEKSKTFPLVTASHKATKYYFNEIHRKRRSDICHSLGKSYKSYIILNSSGHSLFDEETMKRMNQDVVARVINLGAKHFANPKKLRSLSLDPKVQESILIEKQQSTLK